MNIQGINPTLYAPVQGQSASPTVAARSMASAGSSGTGTTSANGLSSGDLQSTFLNLLVTELQNQDPTQPVSPTDMVGQMVSLNQLDQLISINQTLGSLTGTTTTTASGGALPSGASGATASSASGQQAGASQTPQDASSNNILAQAQAAAAAAAQNFNPVVYPANLMNLYGSVGANSNLSIGGGR